MFEKYKRKLDDSTSESTKKIKTVLNNIDLIALFLFSFVLVVGYSR